MRHTKEEGGLNLDMQSGAIELMARSGQLAADEITAAFLPPVGTKAPDDDWQYHRWVRLRLLLPLLRDFLGQLEAGVKPSATQPSIEQFLTGSPAPMGRSHELNRASGAGGWTLLDELAKSSQGVAPQVDFERTAPRPQGTLRVTPTF